MQAKPRALDFGRRLVRSCIIVAALYSDANRAEAAAFMINRPKGTAYVNCYIILRKSSHLPLNTLAACLHSVGFELPRVHDVVPLLIVDVVVEALTARLQSAGSGGLYRLRAAPTQGVVVCTYTSSGLPYV